MTADNETKNGYHPVQNANDATAGEKTKEQRVADEEACQDGQLQQDERCFFNFMQRLASPYLFGFLVCLVFLIQAAAFSSNGGGVLSTIERRFQLKTSELAPFLIANDVMSVIIVLFVTYYGHTSHRPRLIGGGAFIVGVGLLLCTLPQFIYDSPPQFSSKQVEMDNQTTPSAAGGDTYQVCHIADNTTGGEADEVCTEEEERNSGSLMWQVSWIIIGQMLTGVGTTPISPLSITYMDDNLKRTSTSVYVACMFISSSLGSLGGFTISGFCLSINADFLKGPVVSKPGDPNWLGAWWLTYAITGVMIIIASIPIMMFPKQMRVKKEPDGAQDKDGKEQTDVGALYRLDVHKEGKGICASITGFLSAIRRLVTNLTFMSLILGVCAFLFSLVGGFVFMAKYIETQFSVSAAMAPMIFGILMTPGSLFGNLIGGFVVKKLKLTKKGMARMVVLLKPISLVFIIMFFFIGCENRDIAGITVNYPTTNRTTTDLPNLNAQCNTDCACPSEYTPICGSDGVTYATPCHAGCLATVKEVRMGEVDPVNVTVYTNCSCITGPDEHNADAFPHTAVPGECPTGCNALIPFIALSMTSSLLGTIMGNPGFMLQLRTVHDDDRSIAVGFSSLLLRLLGLIPSPIVFGSAIQTACLLLQSSCGKTGNCLVYDIVHFRYVLMGLTFGFDFLAAVAFVVCYFSIKEIKQPETEGFQAMKEVNGGDGTAFTHQELDGDKDFKAVEYNQSAL